MSWWDRRRKAKREAEREAEREELEATQVRWPLPRGWHDLAPRYVKFSVVQDPTSWSTDGKPDASKAD